MYEGFMVKTDEEKFIFIMNNIDKTTCNYMWDIWNMRKSILFKQNEQE